MLSRLYAAAKAFVKALVEDQCLWGVLGGSGGGLRALNGALGGVVGGVPGGGGVRRGLGGGSATPRWLVGTPRVVSLPAAGCGGIEVSAWCYAAVMAGGGPRFWGGTVSVFVPGFLTRSPETLRLSSRSARDRLFRRRGRLSFLACSIWSDLSTHGARSRSGTGTGRRASSRDTGSTLGRARQDRSARTVV